jgi:hypothetical protein
MSKFSFPKCFENPQIYELFSSFLETSYNSELLNFIEQVSDYNLLMSNTYKKQRAKQIIENFIILDSNEEVNISGEKIF